MEQSNTDSTVTLPSVPDATEQFVVVSKAEWDQLRKQVHEMHGYLARMHKGLTPIIEQGAKGGLLGVLGMLKGK